MSQSQVKKYKRAMRREMDAKRREETAMLIYQMTHLPFHQRLRLAWKIIKGQK